MKLYIYIFNVQVVLPRAYVVLPLGPYARNAGESLQSWDLLCCQLQVPLCGCERPGPLHFMLKKQRVVSMRLG